MRYFVQSWVIGTCSALVLSGATFGQPQESLESLMMYGIDDRTHELIRYHLGDDSYEVVGEVHLAGGTVLAEIESLAYIPGQMHLYGVWNYLGDTQSKLVRINVFTAEATPFETDTGFGNVEGLVAVSLKDEGGDGEGDDPGLEGGHFDVDIFAGINRRFHEHQYDDKNDVTFVDLVNSADLKGEWASILGGYGSVRISFKNAHNGSGTYTIKTTAEEWTGNTRDGGPGAITVDPKTVTSLRLDFKSLAELRGTEPGVVEEDNVDRDDAMSVNIEDLAGNLIYQFAVYEHVKKDGGKGQGTDKGKGDPEFTTYNFDVLVGDEFHILEVVDLGGRKLGADFDFVYDDGETWNLDAFNADDMVLLSASDLLGGNHGEGEYRISMRMLKSGDLTDQMTIRVTDDGAGDRFGNVDIDGEININPNNSRRHEFVLTLPNGHQITRDDLHRDSKGYTGPATSIHILPKGNGNQNGLLVDGEPFLLPNGQVYDISAETMAVRVYNDRMVNGKAMGHWWIGIDGARHARISGVEDDGAHLPHHTDGQWLLYGVQTDSAKNSALIQIYPRTGLAESVMPLSRQYEGLAHSGAADGLFIGVSGGELWAIDVDAGTETLIGSDGYFGIEALEFAMGVSNGLQVPGLDDAFTASPDYS